MVSTPLLELNETVMANGVTRFRVTVQLELPGVTIEEGLQVNAVIVIAVEFTVMVPPVAVTVIALPVGDTAKAFLTEITVLVVTEGESVTVASATTPLAMTLELIPVSKHMSLPEPPLQAMLFPAATAAGPAVTDMLVISASA